MSKLAKSTEIKFRMDAFSPSTIPMLRLAEYLTSLAKLLGETGSVHFGEIKKGSTVIVQRIDREAVPKIVARIKRVKLGDGTVEEMSAYWDLNKKLRDDNGIGSLLRGKKATLLTFPGRQVDESIAFGSFSQEGAIEGVPIRVGGKNNMVSVVVQEETRVYFCRANREMAKKIATHLFVNPMRFYGKGRWHRSEIGHWILEEFTISHFEILKDSPLSEVVSELRAVEGSEWDTLADPWAELHKLQQGNESDK